MEVIRDILTLLWKALRYVLFYMVLITLLVFCYALPFFLLYSKVLVRIYSVIPGGALLSVATWIAFFYSCVKVGKYILVRTMKGRKDKPKFL